ncbi:MAG TPA: MtrAB system histidine kinase MtrB [Lacisediminihabitans sp.]|uniref:MtrAB system histidine kinase MtrB n=1 Tax=Lacisediminihabitans sp. TaxID=2787631 RepID=UPI002ED8F46B
MKPLDWRSYPGRIVRIWRTSLQFRTVAITVVSSGIAVFIIGGFISISIGNNLFASRSNQVQDEARSAHNLAQEIFDAVPTTADQGATVDLDSLPGTIRDKVLPSTTTPGGTGFELVRTPDQQTDQIMQSTRTTNFPDVVTDALRARVVRDPQHVQFQSVSLENGAPALVVGSQVNVPSAGSYELYLVYDLSQVQQTLNYVQRTMVIGGLALVLLIAAIMYTVVRLVVGPIRVAAQTSEKLAAGQLEERIPEKGDDVIATLARSFNGMADSLQQQITKLAELSRLQQRFVSDVSHELRTPLTTIRLAGDVLFDQRESFEPSAARTAELLHTQVQRFEVLLADLLEVSRYDAGAVELELDATNLVRLVEDAVDSMRPLADERGSELRIVAPGGYFEAEIDARRVRRILRNLLGNAIEHGEGRPIVVMVDSNATAVALAVRDYGIGMRDSDVSRVFDRFWRADPSRQRTIGGTGLGLAISLEDATLHDGWLDVWSEPGEGTCFRLTLPRERGIPIESSPLDLPPADARLQEGALDV